MQEHPQPYPSDLTDEQWKAIKGYFAAAPMGQRGRPREQSRRSIVNAVLFLVRAGLPWRYLPHDFPPWKTVYNCYRLWTQAGLWAKIHDKLYGQERRRQGRRPSPSAAIIDSQSVQTGDQGGPSGFDAGKKTKGRKRHILVDSVGLILSIMITPASVQDRDGARSLFERVLYWFGRLQVIWADSAYNGGLAEFVKSFRPWGKLRLEVVPRPQDQKGFQVLPRRWVVERTFGWLNKARRLSKDYERNPSHSESMIQIHMIGLMLNRIYKSSKK